jgi:hypothetical protein
VTYTRINDEPIPIKKNCEKKVLIDKKRITRKKSKNSCLCVHDANRTNKINTSIIRRERKTIRPIV